VTRYHLADTVEETLELLRADAGQGRVIAGGTDVMPDLRAGKIEPTVLIDITRIADLGVIEVDPDWITVGAAVTLATIGDHPLLVERVPALGQAVRSVGARAIQNAATWAGNLVQAMPAADGAIVALALEAEARIVDYDGAVWRPVETIFLGPGRSAIDPTRQIVTHIRFPLPPGRWGTAWRRLGRRASLVLPVLNCAVKVELEDGDDGRIRRAAVALGPVALCPLRADAAEEYLVGRVPDEAVLDQAGRLAQGECNPRTSVMRASREYRLAVVPELVRDALSEAVAGAH
jgi:carbon-monoxide dehydrogenase medium subunit